MIVLATYLRFRFLFCNWKHIHRWSWTKWEPLKNFVTTSNSWSEPSWETGLLVLLCTRYLKAYRIPSSPPSRSSLQSPAQATWMSFGGLLILLSLGFSLQLSQPLRDFLHLLISSASTWILPLCQWRHWSRSGAPLILSGSIEILDYDYNQKYDIHNVHQ